MNDTLKEFLEKFKKIAQKGFIKSSSNDWGAIGKTFEKEMGKLPDSSYNPDYKDIEIKCSSRYSRYPLYLFTISFDGPGENEIERITNRYGFYDHDFPDKKVLFRRISNEINKKNKYNFSLDVSYKEKRIYLCIFDSNGNLIEKQAYISFSRLEEHFDRKMRKIAYIKASTKIIDNIKYYRYYCLFFYKIKDFNTFLSLIRKDRLDINLISRINKSGIDAGKNQNKNIVIAISKKNIQLLFDCIFEYNNDVYW